MGCLGKCALSVDPDQKKTRQDKGKYKNKTSFVDYRRRKRLLDWVHSRLLHVSVVDFCSSWQDGVALCALLESVCPGVCPSYHLLQQHNRVKNCRLGLKLAHKYLYLPMVCVNLDFFYHFLIDFSQ